MCTPSWDQGLLIDCEKETISDIKLMYLYTMVYINWAVTLIFIHLIIMVCYCMVAVKETSWSCLHSVCKYLAWNVDQQRGIDSKIV